MPYNFAQLQRTAVAFALITLLSTSAAYAQEAPLITLDDATYKALQGSPRLSSAAAAVAASAGEARQAGAWQNPQLTVEAENFAGRGNYTGYSEAETTVGVTQLFELSGKARRRAAVAKEGVTISQIEHSIEGVSLVDDVYVAYAEAVAAQERLAMAKEQRALAAKLVEEVGDRVSAAREPEIQRSKAQISLSSANYAEQKAERELNHAKHVLSSLWGGHEGEYALLTDYFFDVQVPISEQEAEDALERGMYMKRALAEEDRARAALRLEQIQAVPDPTIGVGLRDLRDTGDQAFVASVSLPIPVLNLNGGGIERARQNAAKSVSDTQAARLKLVNELHEALEAMQNAYANVSNMRSSIIPSAEKAFSQSRKGYSAGRFPYLEVLDAQRTLADVKAQYLDALTQYHQAKSDIVRLTASDMQKAAESKAQ